VTTTTATDTSDQPLTEQLLRHGRILRDWSPETVITYRKSFRDCPAEITKASLNAAVVAMRERGLTPGGINVRLRSINSFLTWAYEEGQIREPLRVKLLKNPPEPLQTFSVYDPPDLVGVGAPCLVFTHWSLIRITTSPVGISPVIPSTRKPMSAPVKTRGSGSGR